MQSKISGYGGECVEGGETQERGENSVGVRGFRGWCGRSVPVKDSIVVLEAEERRKNRERREQGNEGRGDFVQGQTYFR